MKLNSLAELFILELRDMYDAEKQLTKALPKMAKAASSRELKEAFEKHLLETENQLHRLEQVFDYFEVKAKAKTCEAMKGMIEEGKEWIDVGGEDAVRDAALIAAAQKVEHYEIASYGCLTTWAKQLGHQSAAELLGENLAEEKATDKTLTSLAEAEINVEAQQPAEAVR